MKDVYHFTQMCGTPRYMAPEVALGEPYNETCDVYSFAILFWQLLSLEQPYLGKKCTMRYLYDEVWASPKSNSGNNNGKSRKSNGGSNNGDIGSSSRSNNSCTRPPVKDKWPINVQRIMERAWHYDLHSRPAMSEIEDMLHRQVLSFFNVSQKKSTAADLRDSNSTTSSSMRGGDFSVSHHTSLNNNNNSENGEDDYDIDEDMMSILKTYNVK